MVNWLETKGNKPCLPAPIWGSGCSIGKSSCTDPFYSQPALPMEHDWLLLLLYHLRIVRLRMLNHRAWAKNLFLLLVDSVKLSLAVGLRSNTALRCSVSLRGNQLLLMLLLIACLILATIYWSLTNICCSKQALRLVVSSLRQKLILRVNQRSWSGGAKSFGISLLLSSLTSRHMLGMLVSVDSCQHALHANLRSIISPRISILLMLSAFNTNQLANRSMSLLSLKAGIFSWWLLRAGLINIFCVSSVIRSILQTQQNAPLPTFDDVLYI